tara:strand:+ start:190 stop:576 length:387 start_codon:yes stop_codon:yes gene_type:complete
MTAGVPALRSRIPVAFVASVPAVAMITGIASLTASREHYEEIYHQCHELAYVLPPNGWAQVVLGPLSIALPIGGAPYVSAWPCAGLAYLCTFLMTSGSVIRGKWGAMLALIGLGAWILMGIASIVDSV